ncbi:hypothetical protein BGZ54_004499 [Gamsiella multidivaricata]|nr:hypothetical protein BGZ54_004499 [Gamsiella multidivaricata]
MVSGQQHAGTHDTRLAPIDTQNPDLIGRTTPKVDDILLTLHNVSDLGQETVHPTKCSGQSTFSGRRLYLTEYSSFTLKLAAAGGIHLYEWSLDGHSRVRCNPLDQSWPAERIECALASSKSIMESESLKLLGPLRGSDPPTFESSFVMMAPAGFD